MDDRTRQFARSHWAALDAAMSRTIPRDQVDWCREGARWALDDIAAKYTKRLVDAAGDDAHRVGLEPVGRELATALSAAWQTTRNRQA